LSWRGSRFGHVIRFHGLNNPFGRNSHTQPWTVIFPKQRMDWPFHPVARIENHIWVWITPSLRHARSPAGWLTAGKKKKIPLLAELQGAISRSTLPAHGSRFFFNVLIENAPNSAAICREISRDLCRTAAVPKSRWDPTWSGYKIWKPDYFLQFGDPIQPWRPYQPQPVRFPCHRVQPMHHVTAEHDSVFVVVWFHTGYIYI
jgi:hypothetical protein